MPSPEPRDPATGAVLPDLTLARKVLETEAAAILALVAAPRRALRAAPSSSSATAAAG